MEETSTKYLLEIREEHKLFYQFLDSLILNNYNGSSLIEGKYYLENNKIAINIQPRGIWLTVDPTLIVISDFKKSRQKRHKNYPCGFQITPSTGRTYSYPILRDKLPSENPEDILIRANYFFSYVTQIISYFLKRNTFNHWE